MALKPDQLARITTRALAAQPFQSVLILDGRTYKGVRAAAAYSRKFRPEGSSHTVSCTFIGRSADFDLRNLPTIGKLATLDSQSLEIAEIPQADPAGGVIRIDLRPPATAA